MLIGIDASRANRERKTGTEWYSYNLIRQLARLDKENQYILYSDAPLCGGMADLSSDSDFDSACSVDDSSRIKNGWQEIRSPHSNFRAKILRWPLRFFWTQGRLSLEMIYGRPDLLFVPSHALPILHPRRSVVTLHDIGFEREERAYRREEIVRTGYAKRLVDTLIRLISLGKYGANSYDYLRWSTDYALRKARQIITISEFSKKEMIELYKASAEKIAVIHNGYDEGVYRIVDKEKVSAVRTKYGLPEKYILYTGRIEKKKNVATLVEAFALAKAALPDSGFKLVLAGKASYGYDEVKYAIREFNLNDDIIVTGWVVQEDLPALYTGASFYVFPSLYEGFGIPVIEAMACGVPVACSNSSSLPEVAGEAALYFNPRHAKSIADALVKLMSDPELRDNLRKKGLERVRGFEWERCARETLAILVKMQ